MKRTRTVVTVTLSAALAIAPLAGCGTSGQQSDAQQNQTEQNQTEQKQSVIDYMVLVNKQNKLPDGWDDDIDVVEQTSPIHTDPVRVERKAFEAYEDLKDELAKEGVTVELDSCYRSVAEQQEVWDEFTKEYGEEYTKKTVAVPGYSEHQTGLAIDLYLVIDGQDVYENEEMKAHPEVWEKVHEKLADHGFILRYLDGKEDITGYAYEPWHIRYIGDSKVAHEIMDNGLTFEEYLGVADEAKAANAAAKEAEESSNATASNDATAKADYEVDYGTSKVYTKADIDAAVEAVMAEFGSWKGCTMKKIAYTDDDTCASNLKDANSLREDGTPEFDQAMVLTSDFHSPSVADAEGTAWEPDTDYNGYTWTLGRTANGAWELLTWGYA